MSSKEIGVMDIWDIIQNRFSSFCEEVSVATAEVTLTDKKGWVAIHYFDLVSLIEDDNEMPKEKVFVLPSDESNELIQEICDKVGVNEKVVWLKCELNKQKPLEITMYPYEPLEMVEVKATLHL